MSLCPFKIQPAGGVPPGLRDPLGHDLRDLGGEREPELDGFLLVH